MGIGLWKIKHNFQKFYSANGSFRAFARRYFKLLSSINHTDVIYIYADATNIGDYISHLGVHDVFKKNGPTLYASLSCLKETKIWLNVARKKNKNIVLVIGGGGLIQNCFEGFWEVVLASGLPYIVYGVGACTMPGVRYPLQEDLLARISHNALQIHIRDSYTKVLFERLGATNVTLGECPAMDFIRLWKKSYHVMRPQKKKLVLLNVVHDFDLSQSGVDLPSYYQTMKTLCQNIGYEYNQINNIHKKYEILLKQYENADIIVTSRLHGCIIGIGMEKNVIAIACDDKIRNYLYTHYSNPTIISPEVVQDKSALEQMLDRKIIKSGKYRLLPLKTSLSDTQYQKIDHPNNQILRNWG